MKECPICSSSNLLLWGKKNGYSIYQCKSCTHLFADTQSRMDRELNSLDEIDFRAIITNDMMENDDDYYRHLESGEKEGLHSNLTFRVIEKEILKGLNLNPVGSWLDIGSGSGYLIQQVSKLGWDAVGIEPGGWGQIAAREKGINIIQGFLSKDTFKRKFDVISATDVLEHQSNPIEFMELIKFHLKPNGIILFSIPFADSLFARVRKSKWSMLVPPTHCQFFNKKSISFFASKMELSIVKLVQYNSAKFKFFSRFNVTDKLINRLFDLNNWGDQAVIVMKPLALSNNHLL